MLEWTASGRTNQTQEAQVYSHNGPIRCRVRVQSGYSQVTVRVQLGYSQVVAANHAPAPPRAPAPCPSSSGYSQGTVRVQSGYSSQVVAANHAPAPPRAPAPCPSSRLAEPADRGEEAHYKIIKL
eukprot:7302750-Pyramimonas_sp.AAC.1